MGSGKAEFQPAVEVVVVITPSIASTIVPIAAVRTIVIASVTISGLGQDCNGADEGENKERKYLFHGESVFGVIAWDKPKTVPFVKVIPF